MNRFSRSGLAVVLFVLMLAGCASEGSDLPPLSGASTAPGAAPADAAYRLGPGDKLDIKVAGAEDLSGQYTVGDNGTIVAPMIGDVKAAGLTRKDVEREIAHKLAQGYIKHPSVSVSVATYRPFYIFGEVTKPGSYPYASGMRVMNAVATAGGYTYRAQEHYVIVERHGEQRRASPTTQIEPDDVIKVPERYF